MVRREKKLAFFNYEPRSQEAKNDNRCANSFNTSSSSSQASTSSESSYSKPPSNTLLDIGDYTNFKKPKKTVNENIKNVLLRLKFDFNSINCFDKKKEERIFSQIDHLEKIDWLISSQRDMGFYCKYCVVYSNTIIPPSSLTKLVRMPLKMVTTQFVSVLENHQQTSYHQRATKYGNDFIMRDELANPEASVKVFDLPNRNELKSIVETIIFAARHNIPLCGISGDQRIGANNDNLDNFIALLNFRAQSGDRELMNFLETEENNDGESKMKDLLILAINACEKIIQSNILKNVQKAKYFSILFDEVTDKYHKIQLSLSIIYLQNDIITEQFLTFCKMKKTIQFHEENGYEKPQILAEALAESVKKLCDKFEIDLKRCVGIGIDNCTRMDLRTRTAVVQELLKIAINAKRCPSRNVNLTRSLSLVSCRNTSKIIEQVFKFVHASAERRSVFEVIFKEDKPTREEKLYKNQLFRGENLIKMCKALKLISQWKAHEIANEAYCLLQTLRSKDFIISSICLNDVLGKTEILSNKLQYETKVSELKKVADILDSVKTDLQNKRLQAKTQFQKLFQEGKEISEKLEDDLKEFEEENYRSTIYIPLLESVINELEVIELFQFGFLETVEQLATGYKRLFEDFSLQTIQNQYELWIANYSDRDLNSETLYKLLEDCDETAYPSIKDFLNILAVLPASVFKADKVS